MRKKILGFSLLLCALALTVGCGDDKGGVELSIPATVNARDNKDVEVETGKAATITALAKNTEVSWDCAPAEAACQQVGRYGVNYTAPLTPGGPYTITATANADGGRKDTATVNVIWAFPTITLSPTARVPQGNEREFTVTVTLFEGAPDIDAIDIKVIDAKAADPEIGPIESIGTIGTIIRGEDNGLDRIFTFPFTAEVEGTGKFEVTVALPEGYNLHAKESRREVKAKFALTVTPPPPSGCIPGTTITIDAANAGGEELVIAASGLIKDGYGYTDAGYGAYYVFKVEDGSTITFSRTVTMNSAGASVGDISANDPVPIETIGGNYFYLSGQLYVGPYMVFISDSASGYFGSTPLDRPFDQFDVGTIIP